MKGKYKRQAVAELIFTWTFATLIAIPPTYPAKFEDMLNARYQFLFMMHDIDHSCRGLPANLFHQGVRDT